MTDTSREALRADLAAALQRELMQMQRADEAEANLAKAVVCIVEGMIAPEALMIAGKPLGMTNGTWEQMVRSVGHARATLAEIKGERHD